MKKLMILFSIAILISISILYSNKANCQNIIDLSIYPPNPTSLDDIILISENLFTSGPCWLDSSSMSINAFDIKYDTYFSTGMLAVMCTSFDTFQLGPLSDGTYQLHYNLYHPSTSPQLEDSATIAFTVGSVSLSDTKTDKTEFIFPNPTDGKIILKLSENIGDGELIFRIFSMQGRLLKNMELDATKSEIQIDLSVLPSGNYFYDYHHKGNQNYTSGKLVITKH